MITHGVAFVVHGSCAEPDERPGRIAQSCREPRPTRYPRGLRHERQLAVSWLAVEAMVRPWTHRSRALDEWTTYFALMAGAATPRGLLFVAVSLRPNMFHQRAVADVRDYAALMLGTFLVAISVAEVTLAPHDHHAPALLLIGVAGLLGVAWVIRESIQLDRDTSAPRPTAHSNRLRGSLYALFSILPYVAVCAAAVLLWIRHPNALGWLAITEGWLLVSGTVIAWILLSHAGHDDADPTSNEPSSS